VLLGAASVAAAEETCPWCEAGPCDASGSVAKERFAVSISASTGRSYPYWVPRGQARLGEASGARAAFVVHHGAARNGADYTKYAMKGAGDALVFGAQVYEAGDEGLDESRELWWASNSDDGLDDEDAGYDWHWGGESTPELNSTISTFAVLDEILETLLDRRVYPNLTRVVLAGHSAGGQIVQRYALLSTREVDRRVKFFVANPSSVAWLSSDRPVADSSCCDNATIADRVWTFAPFDAASCPTYDIYGYGLSGPLCPYARDLDASLRRYARRYVTYLSGQSDVCNSDAPSCATCVMEDGGLDTSCEALAQGPCRMARLYAFARFVDAYYHGEHAHALLPVPNVGHSGCGMFQSPQFLRAAFGDLPGHLDDDPAASRVGRALP